MQTGAVLEKILGVSGLKLPSRKCKLKFYRSKLFNLISNAIKQMQSSYINEGAIFTYQGIKFSKRQLGLVACPHKIFSRLLSLEAGKCPFVVGQHVFTTDLNSGME